MLLAQNFDSYNPLKLESKLDASTIDQLSTPGGVLNHFLQVYAFPVAGMILFAMIVWGGFEIMTSSVSGKKDAGRQRITTAIIGFVLLFSAYWIAQLVELIFGVSFLGN